MMHFPMCDLCWFKHNVFFIVFSNLTKRIIKTIHFKATFTHGENTASHRAILTHSSLTERTPRPIVLSSHILLAACVSMSKTYWVQLHGRCVCVCSVCDRDANEHPPKSQSSFKSSHFWPRSCLCIGIHSLHLLLLCSELFSASLWSQDPWT